MYQAVHTAMAEICLLLEGLQLVFGWNGTLYLGAAAEEGRPLCPSHFPQVKLDRASLSCFVCFRAIVLEIWSSSFLFTIQAPKHGGYGRLYSTDSCASYFRGSKDHWVRLTTLK